VQPAAHGTATAAASLVARLREAAPKDDVEAAVAAIAGAGDASIRSQMAQAVRDAGVPYPVAIVGDTLAAAANALADGPGLLVWAGTGSFAVARDENGALHRTGGRGHLLGDQGSGYDLVRRAAAAVVLAVDGLSPPTALEHALCEAFAAPSPQRLGAVLQQKTQGDIAKALPIVLACAERGDEVLANLERLRHPIFEREQQLRVPAVGRHRCIRIL
jgi:N-acetylglucosamine kinase-like BadF-type ATPase